MQEVMLCTEEVLVNSINLDELSIYAFQTYLTARQSLTRLKFDKPQCFHYSLYSVKSSYGIVFPFSL